MQDINQQILESLDRSVQMARGLLDSLEVKWPRRAEETAPELDEDKLTQRLEAAKKARKPLSLELYGGKGSLTGYYKDIFDRVFLVEENTAKAGLLKRRLGTGNVFVGDNGDFVEEHLEEVMDFSLVDFDAYGSPAKLIQRFFQKIAGKKASAFILCITDGALGVFTIRGFINLYQHYLQGEDKVIKVTDEMYESFHKIVDEFIRRVAKRHGFIAEKINGVRNSRRTAYYAAYSVKPV